MNPVLCSILALLAGYRLLWPGDASFISDEALLMKQAWEIVQTRTLPSHGLFGSFGTPYGPFALWIYSTILFFTQDLPTVVLIKTLLVTAATLLALFRFSKVTSFGRFGWVALLSPYLWFYSRDLWDNSFLIPLTGLSIVSFLSFEKGKKQLDLILAVLLATLAVLTHLMALPLLAAITIVFFWRHLPYAKKNWQATFVLFLSCFLLALPYLIVLIQAPSPKTGSGPSIASLFFPFYGARFFSVIGYQYILGDGWISQIGPATLSPFLWGCYILTAVAYPLSWWGMVLVVKSWRDHRFLLTLFVLSWALLFFSGRYSHPHYYNSQWFMHLYFLALGLSAVFKLKWGRPLYTTWAAALGVFFFYLPISIHLSQGTRHFRYGPTLNNLVHVASELRQYDSNIAINLNTANSKLFFHTLAFLRDFPAGPSGATKQGALEIRYTDAQPNSGKIELSKER